MTEVERGSFVAKAVFTWLLREESIQSVPWVVEHSSGLYDPVAAARQDTKTRLLSELRNVIACASVDALAQEEVPDGNA